MKKALLTLSLLGISSSVFAAVPAEVTTQIETAQADIATVGAAIVVTAAVAFAYRWIKATFF